ncbi:hypothetical protein FVA74_09050 [Salinibacterium sp. dk2585]|uniref:hypothetical protein n=1 Tax=unclassified Salinibacterium TaxID=2632331 RepID=UPI0011C24790|nr:MULTISPECIES: hypothetical protein [unclassified Salinibacterium]QEE61705.1 hypothetical protein FVA74_09050 [Salinibacterium sp. dk2585]TXK54740.1 hypothetical protein FVP63_06910 [Salinibacterium sp. dk5596]
MVEWFTVVQVAVAVAAGLFCLVAGLMGRLPNDFTLGATAVVLVFLLGQVVVALIAPVVGNVASGSLLEFWTYLVSAVLLPPLAGFWALIERNRWSNVILGVVCLAVAVMVWRMNEIWFVQGA